MPKPNKNSHAARSFPGARRAPVLRDEPEESPTGRRGRVRRGRFAGKNTPGDRPAFAGKDGFAGKGFKGGKGGKGAWAGKSGRFGARQGEEHDEEGIADGDLRFSDLLMQLARREFPELVQGNNHPEPLARIPYDKEVELKNRALQEFWTARGLPDKPNKVLASPRGRGYRTTTKRRVISLKGRYELAFMTESTLAMNPKASSESLVEPREHKAVYAFMLSKLNTPAYSGLAAALNYLIIRGDYTRFTVLFNVHRLNADVVRKAKMMGEHLKEMDPKVGSAFMFFDPSKSDFYFEARNPEGPWKIKKIYGPDDIHLKVLERTYSFHPTSFCQVNASILPLFLEKADQLLKPKPEYRLLDLYSGFGFFTLHLGGRYGEALGVDLGQASIESAQKMAAADPSAHCRFKAGRLSVKTLEKLLPPATGDKPEVLLLDPPRQGTEPGVIRALAARNPARILHIFCDLDTLPKEVNQWRKSGFMVSKVVPLDMFPGTDHLEVMVLFIPDRYGILNRIDKNKSQASDEDAVEGLEGVEESEAGDGDFLIDEEGLLSDEPPRPAKKGRFGKETRPAKPGRFEKGERPEKPGRFAKGDQFGKSDRPAAAGRFDRAERPAGKSRDRDFTPGHHASEKQRTDRFGGGKPKSGFKPRGGKPAVRGDRDDRAPRGKRPDSRNRSAGPATRGESRDKDDGFIQRGRDNRDARPGARPQRGDRKPRRPRN